MQREKYCKGFRLPIYSSAFKKSSIAIWLRRRLNMIFNPSNAIKRIHTNAILLMFQRLKNLTKSNMSIIVVTTTRRGSCLENKLHIQHSSVNPGSWTMELLFAVVSWKMSPHSTSLIVSAYEVQSVKT